MTVVGALAIVVVALVGSAGCSGNGRSAKAFCESLRSGSDPVALFAAGNGTADQASQGVARLKELEGKAPSPISDALAHLAEVGADIQQALAARTTSSAGAAPATIPPSDAEKAANAAATVTQYASEKCAVSLSSGG